jgi:NodT family efflux transporter outer membrane factor (OMF) lipoprotein
MNERVSRCRMAVLASAAVALSTTSCAIGPKYVRPQTPTLAAYREALPAGWTDAKPDDAAARGPWWRMFNEPALDALEDQVNISNQNVLAAEAQYRAARAAVRVTAGQLRPTITATPSVTRADGGAAQHHGDLYDVPVDVSYQADVWGSIRRSVAANAAVAQASAADLESARLLYQSELASDYFQVQGLDADRMLLEDTVRSYEQYLQLTQDRFQGGVVSMADVSLAQTQLEGARAQLADVGIARAQFEHAIAVLTGRSPAQLSIPLAPTQPSPPVVPVGLPSSLLERRPDVAAAERRVAAANQEIGVAKAAFYPVLSLGGSAGSQAVEIADLFTAPTRLWSVGAQLAATLFDGGKRRAQVNVSQSAYDSTIANYRETVLTGFQQVEDALADLRILAQETDIVDRAVVAAQQSLDISTIQYRGGLANYLQVITAQTSLLQSQRQSVDLRIRRLVGSVSLVQALGGGWSASQLPTTQEVSRTHAGRANSAPADGARAGAARAGVRR